MRVAMWILVAGLTACSGSSSSTEPPEGGPTEGTQTPPTEEVVPSEGTPVPVTTPEVAPTPGAAPVEVAGGLTPQAIDDASRLAAVFDPWSNVKRVEEKLGAPKKIDGNKHIWSVKDGEQCKVLTLEKLGDNVGSSLVETKSCP